MKRQKYLLTVRDCVITEKQSYDKATANHWKLERTKLKNDDCQTPVVAEAHTVVDPRTMVIHLQDALPTNLRMHHLGLDQKGEKKQSAARRALQWWARGGFESKHLQRRKISDCNVSCLGAIWTSCVSRVLLFSPLPNGVIDNRSTGNGRQFESKGDIRHRKTERLCLATESNQSQDSAFKTGSLNLYNLYIKKGPKMCSAQVLHICYSPNSGTMKPWTTWIAVSEAAGHRTCGTVSTEERPCQARHLSPHHLHPEDSHRKHSQVISWSSLGMGEVLPHEGKQPLRSCTSHWPSIACK